MGVLLCGCVVVWVCCCVGVLLCGCLVVYFVARLAWLLLGGRVGDGWLGVLCWVGGLLCGLSLVGLMGEGLQSMAYFRWAGG